MDATPSSKRQAAYKLGLRQEAMAAWLLRLKGFSVVARRYRSPYGEVDLIVRRGKLVLFVEIKARPTAEEALASISQQQQQRILNASQHFLESRGWKADKLTLRFDAVACVKGKLPRHLPDAWRA